MADGGSSTESSAAIPAGYMAKFVTSRPEWLDAERVRDLYSLSDHGSKNFESSIEDWQEGEVEPSNGYRLYDSPGLIRELAGTHRVDLADSTLFYYELYGLEYDEDDARWYPFEPSFRSSGVVVPSLKRLEGYDVVAFFDGEVPACSPLFCNRVANAVETNEHCLLPSLKRARQLLSEGAFDETEPGPFRIFAVFSVGWPE
jgi:hypothetical protein